MQPDQELQCCLFVITVTFFVLFCFVLDIIYLILFRDQHFKMNADNGFILDNNRPLQGTGILFFFTLDPLEFQLFSNIVHAASSREGARIPNFLTYEHMEFHFFCSEVEEFQTFLSKFYFGIPGSFCQQPLKFQTFC